MESTYYIHISCCSELFVLINQFAQITKLLTGLYLTLNCIIYQSRYASNATGWLADAMWKSHDEHEIEND